MYTNKPDYPLQRYSVLCFLQWNNNVVKSRILETIGEADRLAQQWSKPTKEFSGLTYYVVVVPFTVDADNVAYI